MIERLEQIAFRAEREPVEAAVYFLDLNGFKRVNDEHGHEAGDRVLVAVAHALRDDLRGGDSAARLGGDEFVVVCEQIADDVVAALIAARLTATVARPIQLDNGAEVSMHVSIGIHRFGMTPFDPEAILRDADGAMYEAKSTTRPRFAVRPPPVVSSPESRPRPRPASRA